VRILDPQILPVAITLFPLFQRREEPGRHDGVRVDGEDPILDAFVLPLDDEVVDRFGDAGGGGAGGDGGGRDGGGGEFGGGVVGRWGVVWLLNNGLASRETGMRIITY
jgi:uncharacterized membrane protein YgcG